MPNGSTGGKSGKKLATIRLGTHKKHEEDEHDK